MLQMTVIDRNCPVCKGLVAAERTNYSAEENEQAGWINYAHYRVYCGNCGVLLAPEIWLKLDDPT